MRKPTSADRFRSPARELHQDTDNGPRVSRSAWLAVLALAALALLWLVIRVSVANAAFQYRPDIAASLAPKHPKAILGAQNPAQLEVGVPEGRTAEARFPAEAPLDEQPLLAAARLAIQNGDRQRATLLVDEAIRRNPRSRYGLLLRLDQQLRQNRVNDAAVTIAVLSRLLPNSGPALVNLLARMATDPEVRNALAGVLAADGHMRADLLEALARQGADPNAILSLAGPLKPAPVDRTPAWQAIMLNALIDRGQVTQAGQVWNRLAGVNGAIDGIYDPDFTGLPGPPPFNWKLQTAPAGFAERARGQGLYVEFYGRENAVLGEQLLTLPAGGHRLAFQADGNADEEGGRVAWTITCQDSGGTLAILPITGIDASSQAFAKTFTVPNNCPAQWLRLTGKFGEFSKDQRITISKLRIAVAGRP